MDTLRGEPVDRPAVSFYEINGFDRDQNPDGSDPFNIYSDPSWRPLMKLAREHTDLILRRPPPLVDRPPSPSAAVSDTQVAWRDGCRVVTTTMRAGGRRLTSRTRQDPDINTVWTEEHLLKTIEDVEAFLDLPRPLPGGRVDTAVITDLEDELGDAGIVMLDTADPLCEAASRFSMEDYTVIAMTEPSLFHRLLERFAEVLIPATEAAAAALPGRLWRIFGPEYASPPYLPPALFREYVCRYTGPMVAAIRRYGGYPRLHCHGNLRRILDDMASMGIAGLDPIEPPPQGDVELAYVRERYGKHWVLFGNLEASDIENLPTNLFADKIDRALREGTAGDGRGFVLMPSACPYGRHLSALAMKNYEKMVEMVEAL